MTYNVATPIAANCTCDSPHVAPKELPRVPTHRRLLARFAFSAAFVAAGLTASCLPAFANDGGIAFGGSPGLLKGHPSVTMTQEVIRVDVDKDHITVDCRFTFTNHGPACTVRMGFPDRGVGASDPDEEDGDAAAERKPAKTTFTSFRSYVDGKAVASELIRSDKPGEYWHTKTVRFPSNGVVSVRDVYTQPVGGGVIVAAGRSGNVSQVGYILHTGASWHGAIGRTEVTVTFHDSKLPAHLKAVPLAKVSKPDDARDLRGKIPEPDAVVWKGPVAPSVTGKTLRFVRENWNPTPADDILLNYAYVTQPALAQ